MKNTENTELEPELQSKDIQKKLKLIEKAFRWDNECKRNNKQNKYVLNAHGLTPNEDFELICYLDPWPGDYSVLLGAGTSDEEGNLHIQDYVNVTELHEIAQTKLESAEYQENPDAAVLADGQKIWIVPAADFDEDAQVMIGWNPDDILFEFDLLKQEPID